MRKSIVREGDQKDLKCLHSGYFEIIYKDERDVTIMFGNIKHVWYI